ncbi:MAG: LysE family transporter, partial [Loktanella sp.]|nr:LysE family transporter [Loktanella sp.]
MIQAAATGFVTAFALILAIGAQNAFVLRQGLARAHVFWLCLFCATSDALLITAGVLGFGAMVEA